MAVRQQVLQLWTAEAALDTPVVAWAFHDGCEGRGPALAEGEPPYATGVAALGDGWFLLQAPSPRSVAAGAEHDAGPLSHEFVFERRVEIED